MKEKKLVIAILAIIIIIIILISIILKISSIEEKQVETNFEEINLNAENSNINKLIDKQSYIYMKNIVEKYFSYCTELTTTPDEIEIFKQTTDDVTYREEMAKSKKESAKENLYNILDNIYINEFGITKDNITEKLGIQNEVNFVIDEIFLIENSNNIMNYFIYGMYNDEKTLKTTNFELIINVDPLKKTFSILPQDYVTKYNLNNVKEDSKIDIKINNIEDKKNNHIKYDVISVSQICTEFLENYKFNALYNTKKAYNMLGAEYRNERFKSFEDYKKYVEYNKNEIANAEVLKYDYEAKLEYQQYIVVDKNENYYIFNEKSWVDHSIMLDTYTIGLPEFIEKYNKSTDIEKVGYNIQRCIEAINAKDYSYVYRKLDETFKNNNYKTEEEFKNYIVNNLFEKNTVDTDISTSNENGIYVYNITIKNKDNENETKKMEVIMKIETGTNFTMSFNIK